MKILLLAASVSAGLVTAPSFAQDIHPVLDLPTLAQGQVISSTANNQGRRATRTPRPNANQVFACSQRPRLRREAGRHHPKLQKLERLCRGVGL